jgi:hypothetical protein
MRAAGAATVAAVSLALAGCVARIDEQRVLGATQPAAGSRTDVAEERRTGDAETKASVKGAELDVSVERPVECRTVSTMTEAVREVEIRRTFANPRAQEVNAGLAWTLGLGLGIVAFGWNNLACVNGVNGCADKTSSAAPTFEWGLAALAAVPLGFLVYNAVRARDGWSEERGPATSTTEWRRCGTEGLAGEEITVTLGTAVQTGRTGANGHAAFELPGAPPPVAVVRRAGSPDLTVRLY